MAFDLRPYQRQAIDLAYQRVAEGHRPIICAPTGCHAPGTLILMADGSAKPVEKIRVGDHVMGHDSRPRTVLELHTGIDEMFRIVPVKGEPFTVNGDHVLAVKVTNDGSRHAGSIETITVRDWLRASKTYRHTRKLFRVAVDFPAAQPLPIDPYMLGVLLGDGSLGHGITVTKPDAEIWQAAREFADGYGIAVNDVTCGGRCPTFSLVTARGRPNHLRAQLRELGLLGTSSGTKFIPQVYKTASREYRLQLLAGLIDTDGSLGNGYYDFVSKSRRLADDVAFVARSVGLAAYVKPCLKSCGDFTGEYFRVSISGHCDMIPCRVERKKCPPRRQVKDVLVTGFHVEPAGVGVYYGFECDGDHLYVLGDFTVTHNSGKTVIAGHIAREAIEQGKRVLWMTGREEILRQTFTTFNEICGRGNVGILMRQERPWWFYPPVTVASWDTLKARWNKSDVWHIPADLVLVDECHLALSEVMSRTIMPHYRERTVIGLTATPARRSGRGLGQYFTRIIQVRSVQQLIDEGFLAPCEYWAGSHVDVSRLHVDRKTNDYQERELARAALEGKLIGDILDNWLRLARDRHTIAFAVDIAHAQALVERFQQAAISAEVIHSKMTHQTRAHITEQFREQKIQVLWNVGIATYGFDCPSISCVVLARPTKSIVLHHQMIGRGLRPKPDGGYCMVLDHADNVRRLGCIEDEIRWRLDEGREAATNTTREGDPSRNQAPAAPPTECAQCHHIFARSRVCPKCGWEKPVRGQDIETVQADLVRIRKAQSTGATATPATKDERRRWYQMALGWCAQNGAKPGMAYYVYRDRFGEDAPYAWSQLERLAPDERVSAYMLSRVIRYRQQRRKERWRQQREQMEMSA